MNHVLPPNLSFCVNKEISSLFKQHNYSTLIYLNMGSCEGREPSADALGGIGH